VVGVAKQARRQGAAEDRADAVMAAEVHRLVAGPEQRAMGLDPICIARDASASPATAVAKLRRLVEARAS